MELTGDKEGWEGKGKSCRRSIATCDFIANFIITIAIISIPPYFFQKISRKKEY